MRTLLLWFHDVDSTRRSSATLQSLAPASWPKPSHTLTVFPEHAASRPTSGHDEAPIAGGGVCGAGGEEVGALWGERGRREVGASHGPGPSLSFKPAREAAVRQKSSRKLAGSRVYGRV